MRQVLLALAVVTLLSNAYCTDPKYRLDTPITPSSYQLIITPYFDTGDDRQFTFDGDVTIKFTTDDAINQIKLHSQDLTFSQQNITVSRADGSNPLTIASVEFDEAYTFVYINLTSDLQTNFEYSVRIVYTGPIRPDLNGFYRNYYIENGVKKWLGATQMEPTHARKAFPCFDEPGLKATFTVIIDRPQTYKPSLSNTEIQSTTDLGNGYVRETFYPTPKMSTYLVAFLVSEFEAAQFLKNGTQEVGVYTRPEAKNQSEFTFDFAKRVVDALGSYLGVDYYSTDEHLRFDHVALTDFRAGAMENWGLIKYREALLLYVPEDSTPYYKYRVAQIVAHETTHMWFGNLVTCHWWSNTWLNEGFANYFQDYITSLIQPDVASGNVLVTGSVYSAYDADDSPSSPPISNPNVNSPAEISGHFGTVTYQKAGSVIRMMHHLIGDEAFKFGLNSYLTSNALSVGYPDLMYAALNSGVVFANNSLSAYSSGVTEIMSSWISQAGHPILHVNVNYETDTITLTQKRFYLNSSYSSSEIYKIPITYTTETSPDFVNTKPMFILENQTHEFTVANISQNHPWIIFNVQETGFYRVNYDDHAWQIISAALKGNAKKIHNLNRAKIVNDLFAFLYADEVSFSRVYNVLEFLKEETDYSVWFAAVKGLNKLWKNFLGDEALSDIEAYAVHLVEGGIGKIGFEVKSTDDFETLRNRMQLLELACKLGHQGCLDYTLALFKALKENGTEITPSLRPVAYCTGLRYGNGEDYDFLWNRAMTTNVANEARIIIDALSCTTAEEKLQSYLVSMLVENSFVKTQDLTVPLTNVLANYKNINIVMNGLKSNYSAWASIYSSMDTVLNSVASALHTEKDFEEFEAWLDTCTECTEDVKTAALSTLAQSKASRSWAESHKDDILKSLRNFSFKTLPSILTMVAAIITILVLY